MALASRERGRLFFEPVELHLQAPNLLVQRGRDRLRGRLLTACGWAKDFRQMLEDLAFPLADLGGVDLVLAGELGGGLKAADRLEGNAGLEIGAMALAGSGQG